MKRNQRIYLVLLLLAIVALFASCWVFPKRKEDGALALGATLVKALDAYAEANDRYPARLADLVPAYLAKKPYERDLDAGRGNGEYEVTYQLGEGGYRLEIRYVGPGVNDCSYDPTQFPGGWKCSGHY